MVRVAELRTELLLKEERGAEVEQQARYLVTTPYYGYTYYGAEVEQQVLLRPPPLTTAPLRELLTTAPYHSCSPLMHCP